MAISSGANSPVQAIKERLGIEEVVSSYLKLEKAGANLKAKCPFHNEKTPSFFVSPSRDSYYCFGCGAKGDIFTFVEEFEGLDFKGALKLLADRAGVELPKWSGESKRDLSEKERLYEIIEKAAEYYRENLKKEKDAMEYLKSRGLADKTVADFEIGFAVPAWSGLYDRFKKTYSDAELEKAGLVKKGERGYYDRFRGRIMFPVSDSSGRVVAFSGRIFPPEAGKDGGAPSAPDKTAAKYLNSPETPIFKKSAVLYGIDKAKDSIRKNDFSIIVEGQFDLLMSHQAGFRNTLATLGTALADSDRGEDGTVNNLGVVKRLSQNIVFVFDPDKAGFAAALRAAATALSMDMNVKGAATEEGYDPADLVLKKGPDAWRAVIRNSKHIIEFLLDRFLASGEKDPLKTKLLVEEKIIPYLSYIQSPVKKSHFVSVISEKTGIREEDIRQSLEKKEKEKADDSSTGKSIEGSGQGKEPAKNILRKDYILRRLLGIALWQKGLEKPIMESDILLGKIAGIMNASEEEMLSLAEASGPDLVFEAEVFYGADSLDAEKDAAEMLLNLEEEYLKAELATEMRNLRDTESSADRKDVPEILKKIDKINKRIQIIKSGRF